MFITLFVKNILYLDKTNLRKYLCNKKFLLLKSIRKLIFNSKNFTLYLNWRIYAKSSSILSLIWDWTALISRLASIGTTLSP